ncbi:MAG: hypothetical protein M1837_003054 [Sclerophora amabilis]|nr:MAG: hypothetical protein M1837_003054 [Sclerophora amabilis]
MPSPKPFTVDIPQSKIDILKQKLSLAEFPDQLEGAAWELGCPLDEIKRLVVTWKQWDWRQAEKTLNEHPHFHTDIEVDGFGGLDIHFVHQRSEVTGAIPLLFLHGWPGSFIEVLKILPLLAQHDGSSPAFHVVAPSLPNFGFSQGVSKRGFALAQYAETCHKLMLQLGYNDYVTQGGDWGFWITRSIGMLYPHSCKASHLNMIYSKAPSYSHNPLLALQHSITPYSERDKKELERTEWFRKEGRGYNVLQSTKPQTVTYALQDSPVALLAWIYEKLHDWSDAYPWTDDEILTWISIYQFSRAGPGAAHRIYYEVMHTAADKANDQGEGLTYENLLGHTRSVKLGLTYNPVELEMMPKTWGRTLGDVVHEAENERGGHFYAHEYPDLLVRDVRAMFGKGGGAYGLIVGKDGYESRS